MGKNYVYACVYSTDKQYFLVPRKKRYGYFFQWNRVAEQVLNFSGQDVFPGGGLKTNQTPVQGALAEFQEETGIDLSAIATHQGTYEFDYDINGYKGKYYGVYYTVPDLTALRDRINQNLELDVADKIQVVEDDELNNMEIYDAATARQMLGRFDATEAAPEYNGQTDKSWFIDILNRVP
jgi:8-oxo-dGTP pyrophosphatase MutT (NUDIX family)